MANPPFRSLLASSSVAQGLLASGSTASGFVPGRAELMGDAREDSHGEGRRMSRRDAREVAGVTAVAGVTDATAATAAKGVSGVTAVTGANGVTALNGVNGVTVMTDVSGATGEADERRFAAAVAPWKNPYLIALAVIGAAMSCTGAWLFGSAYAAFNEGVAIQTQGDFAAMQVAMYSGPLVVLFGLGTLVGVLFMVAGRWRPRQDPFE